MAFRFVNGRLLTAFSVSSFILVVAGCQSSGNNGVETADGSAPPKVTQEDLRAFCPQVKLREGTAYFNTYAKGGQDDPSKIIYQASISDVTRSCARGDGTMTMNVAVAGRIVPGPAGSAGNITMPIRIAVVRGDEVLYSKLHQHQVSAGAASTQFVFNDAAVSFPMPNDRSVQVFAGFDEGPPSKK
ncbi:hypothetical protein ABFT80_21240 [Mesorhizobium sp. SB112]|uniref:hypothetical protein n=1 Tax=Mesorhizobium sp. SB112 TaxID=3151853 RepID=UPI0032648814